MNHGLLRNNAHFAHQSIADNLRRQGPVNGIALSTRVHKYTKDYNLMTTSKFREAFYSYCKTITIVTNRSFGLRDELTAAGRIGGDINRGIRSFRKKGLKVSLLRGTLLSVNVRNNKTNGLPNLHCHSPMLTFDYNWVVYR